MNNPALIILLMISALFSSVAVVFASDLPACPSSQPFHNCFGTYTFGPNSKFAGNKYVGEFRNNKRNGKGTATWSPNSPSAGHKYVGEWKNDKFHGMGIYYFADGRIKEGIWKNHRFQYSQRTPYSYQRSALHKAFNKLSKNQRKQVQSNLKDLGFYRRQ